MSAVVGMITCHPSCGVVSPGHIEAFPHFSQAPTPPYLRQLVNSGTKAGVVSFVEHKQAATSLWGAKGHRPGVLMSQAPQCPWTFPLTR